jgi:TadE-like protein
MMAPTFVKRLIADRRGSALVEFAFAMPVMMIIFLGVTEIGRAIQYHEAITDGSRAAVRYLTRLPDPCSDAAMNDAVSLVVTRTLGWSGPPLFPDWPSSYAAAKSSTRFTATRDGCDPGTGKLTGSTLTLTVQYTFGDYVGWMSWVGHPGGILMTAVHQERYIGI